MSPLETLLIVYMFLLVLNAGVAVVLWTVYHKPILCLLIGVWVFTLINFIAQALTLNSTLGSILGFSTYILTVWCLCKILAQVVKLPFNFRPMGLLFGLGLVASVAGMLLLGTPSWDEPAAIYLALPVAIALAVPQLYWAWVVLRMANEPGLRLVKWFSVVLLINGLHFLDYPFLRPINELAVLGYSVVIATSMLFGILLPCIINNFLASQLAGQLLDEIESHKATELELEQALKAAETSSKAKTIFLANMSHEIRTPINGIVGLNDLILESGLTEQQKTYADQVKKSSDELLNIVNNILTLAQLESAEVPLQPKVFCLQQLANDILAHYNLRGTGESILHLTPGSDLQVSIRADEGKIKQVCYNLINNAIKHSHAPDIHLAMGFVSTRHNEGEMWLSVTDNGIGIPRGKIAHLTRRFEQDEYSAKGGVGLGLSIVIEMLSAMDGSFFVDGDIGQGLTARCVIPVTLVDKVADVAPWEAPCEETTKRKAAFLAGQPVFAAPVENAVSMSSGPEKSKIVLIVEDNPVNQMVIEGMLRKMNLPYQLATNGRQAMELYRAYQHRLFCILMDVQLPDANGLDLIAEIRAAGDKVKILVLSAFAFSEDEERATQVGADGYLRKPYHYEHLKNALRNLVDPDD